MILIYMCSKQHQYSSMASSSTLFITVLSPREDLKRHLRSINFQIHNYDYSRTPFFFEVADLLHFYCKGGRSAPAGRGSAAPWCHAGAISAVAAPIRSERPSGKLKYVREKTCWQIDGECWHISVNHNTKGVNQDQEECPPSWEVISHLN